MDQKTIVGQITFIHHDKNYASIKYTLNGKKKTINGSVDEKEQLKLKAEMIIKKIHRFHIGDEVNFIIIPSARGDKMIADCIQYRFNNALDNLINKAEVENRFVGYLKKVGADFFVKETGSYISLPLVLSAWEKPPRENKLNDPVFFKLENTSKPDKLYASLFKSEYIPEYIAAMQFFKKKAVLDATVHKITPHGIFINVVGDKIQAKIPLKKINSNTSGKAAIKIGDTIKIIISYLSSTKIIVEKV